MFAVACNAQNSNECRFIVFDPSTPVPKFVHAIPEICKALAWIPVENDEAHTSSMSSNIVYLNQKYDLQVLHASEDEVETEQPEAPLAKGDETSLFADIFGKKHKSNEDRRWDQQRIETAEAMRREAATASRSSVATKAKHGPESSVLEAPSHVIPGVDNIFELFMDSIMPKRPDAEEQEDDVEEGDEEAIASHDESDVETSTDIIEAEPMLTDGVEQEIKLGPAFDSLREFFTKTAGMFSTRTIQLNIFSLPSTYYCSFRIEH